MPPAAPVEAFEEEEAPPLGLSGRPPGLVKTLEEVPLLCLLIGGINWEMAGKSQAQFCFFFMLKNVMFEVLCFLGCFRVIVCWVLPV